MEVVNTENQLIHKLRTINLLHVDVFMQLQSRRKPGNWSNLRKVETQQKEKTYRYGKSCVNNTTKMVDVCIYPDDMFRPRQWPSSGLHK
jgi:hypothetical protein